MTMQSTVLRRSAAASTSAGLRRSFAPLTTKMRFWPLGSTKMGATPLDAPSICLTCVASMPSFLKFSMVAGPKRSLPTRATMKTSAPQRREATAWLAPLPPKPRSNFWPKMVSPALGKRSLKVGRSMLALPITAMRVFGMTVSWLICGRLASLGGGVWVCQRRVPVKCPLRINDCKSGVAPREGDEQGSTCRNSRSHNAEETRLRDTLQVFSQPVIVRNKSSLSWHVETDAIGVEHLGAKICEHSVLKFAISTAFDIIHGRPCCVFGPRLALSCLRQ